MLLPEKFSIPSPVAQLGISPIVSIVVPEGHFKPRATFSAFDNTRRVPRQKQYIVSWFGAQFGEAHR